MSFSLRLTLTAAAAFTLASCGGGAGAPPQPSTGWVAGGAIAGATVTCDQNNNGAADAGEASVTSDGAGRYTFAAPGCDAPLVARGGLATDTNQAFKGILRAPAGARVVTPLTTLLVAGLGADRATASLGLPANTNLAATDPASDLALLKASLAMAQLLDKTIEAFAALGGASTDLAALQALHAEAAAAFAVLLQGGGSLMSASTVDTALTTSLVKAAAQRVAGSSTVAPAVKTALAALNADALAMVMAAGLKLQAQHVMQAEAAGLKAAATAAHADDTVTTFVLAHLTALAAAPTAATNALAATLGELVRAALNPPVSAPGTLPISFDEATPVIFLGFNGAEGSRIEAGPAGGNGKALRVLRLGGDPWAGAFVATTALPLAADRKTLTARVYSPTAGVPMVIKLEGAGGLSSAEFAATTPVVAGWQTLTWVATGIDLSKTYTQITLLPNLSTVDAAPGQSYYFDDLALVADTVVPPPPVAVALPVSFDEAVPPTLGQFGNGAAVAIAAGPEGGSANALRFTKSAGDTWAGLYFDTATIPFSATHRTITARVHSSKAGAPMVMKIEGPGGVATAEVAATPATVVGWQTLRWTFPALDLSKTHNRIVILPDSGNVGSGQVYHFDDVALAADTVAPPVVTDYLTLRTDALSLVNGGTTRAYTLAEFESAAGISVQWPVASPTLMKVALSEVGTLALPANLKVSAAVSITETTPGGKGEIQAYIDNVSLTRTATGLEVAVPNVAANALVYTVSSNGSKKAVIDFGSAVAGVRHTLSTAAGITNNLVLGEVLQYAVNQISNDFSGIYALRGKYRVTIVLSDVPLRRSDGTALPTQTVVVPTVLTETGGVATSRTVTGVGLTGYITLTD